MIIEGRLRQRIYSAARFASVRGVGKDVCEVMFETEDGILVVRMMRGAVEQYLELGGCYDVTVTGGRVEISV